MAKSKTKSRAMAAAEEAEKEAAEHRDTPEKERARMDELQGAGTAHGPRAMPSTAAAPSGSELVRVVSADRSAVSGRPGH